MTSTLEQRVIAALNDLRPMYYARIAPDLTIADASPNMHDLLSERAETLAGRPLTDVLWEFFGSEHLLEAVLAGERDSYELARVNREADDGSTRYLNFRVVPYDDDDPGRGLLLIIEDTTRFGQLEQQLITRRNELTIAQEELQRYARELEMRNRELDAFSHTVAHDLRAPLTRIIGYLDLVLQTSKSKSEDYEILELVKRASLDMNEMISSILLLANLRHAEEVIAEVDMQRIAERVIERLESRINERGVTVTIEQTLPAVMGYGPWLEEVLANLVENAIKYSGEDNAEPRITIRGFKYAGRVRIEVEDNGIGIRVADQERLFEMFSRANVRAADGYGLGLSIVQRIIAKLGGTLGVESDFGRGSLFWFTLPEVN